MIDRAVERDGPTYVRENIDRLLAGINIVRTIDKAALEVSKVTDAAVNGGSRRRALTRRLHEHKRVGLPTTSHQLTSRSDSQILSIHSLVRVRLTRQLGGTGGRAWSPVPC
jgi:hypothetical protein